VLARGKSRIALALAAPGWEGNPMSERLRGYNEELAAQGLAVDPALIWVGKELNAEPALHAADVVSRLVGQGHADAILASNDLWGVEIVKELHNRKLNIPGDVAVVGFDNLNIAERFAPALTTIDQQHEAFAQAVMSILRDVAPSASNATPTHHVVIEPRLVVRETT
jgi:DNA-binding LacI/PurR family transcriptional regulator